MVKKIDAQWLQMTLEDAALSLNAAIERLAADPRSAAGVLEHEIPELYAKLNYAVNTAMGPADLDRTDHDALVAWPASMPFAMGRSSSDDHKDLDDEPDEPLEEDDDDNFAGDPGDEDEGRQKPGAKPAAKEAPAADDDDDDDDGIEPDQGDNDDDFAGDPDDEDESLGDGVTGVRGGSGKNSKNG